MHCEISKGQSWPHTLESQHPLSLQRAIRTWQGYFRTWRVHFKDQIHSKLDLQPPLFAWLVMWAADALCRYKVHSTGRTSHEMMTGHTANGGPPGFGEQVMFRNAPEKRKARGESEWEIGIFVGMITRTNEFLVMTDGEFVKTTNVKRNPEVEPYKRD